MSSRVVISVVIVSPSGIVHAPPNRDTVEGATWCQTGVRPGATPRIGVERPGTLDEVTCPACLADIAGFLRGQRRRRLAKTGVVL